MPRRRCLDWPMGVGLSLNGVYGGRTAIVGIDWVGMATVSSVGRGRSPADGAGLGDESWTALLCRRAWLLVAASVHLGRLKTGRELAGSRPLDRGRSCRISGPCNCWHDVRQKNRHEIVDDVRQKNRHEEVFLQE